MTIDAPTLGIGNGSSTDAQNYNTASYTPPNGALILVFVVTGKASGGALAATAVTHPNMGSLTNVLTIATANNNLVLTVWKGVGTGVAGAFTINHSATMENCVWQVVPITSNVATPIVKQSNTLASVATGSVGATLSTAPGSSSCVIGVFGYNNTSDAPTVGTGFTGIGLRVVQTSPTIALWSEYDLTSPPSQAPFNFTAAAGKALAVLEVSEPAVTGPTLKVWNGTSEVTGTLSIWNGTTEVPATLEIV